MKGAQSLCRDAVGRSAPPAHSKVDAAGVSHGGGAIMIFHRRERFSWMRNPKTLGGSGISVELKISNLSFGPFLSPP